MHQSEQTTTGTPPSERERILKKPYLKPAFRQERLFETSALSCGKVTSTQSGCHSNRKNS
jgi:hypothetical protein